MSPTPTDSPQTTDDLTCGCEKGSPPFVCDEFRNRGDGLCEACEHMEGCHSDHDHLIAAEAGRYAKQVFRDSPSSRDAYFMGVRFALQKTRAERERLQGLIPTGDYVLVDDMSEETSRRWGKGGHMSKRQTTAVFDYVDVLRAEIERLRAALERMAHAQMGPEWFRAVAFEALSGASPSSSSGTAPTVTDGGQAEAVEPYLKKLPSAHIVQHEDGWQHLASTEADAKHIQTLQGGGKIIPLYEKLTEETSAPRCHFMAFRKPEFRCTKSEGHGGPHSCGTAPETQPVSPGKASAARFECTCLPSGRETCTAGGPPYWTMCKTCGGAVNGKGDDR